MRRSFIIFLSVGILVAVNITVTGAVANPWKQVLKAEVPCNIAGFLNSSYGIAVGKSGATRYTTDGGQTWQTGRNQAANLLGLEILNTQYAWSCGAEAQVRVTTSGGKEWQALSPFGMPFGGFHQGSFELPVHPRYLSFVTKQYGWIASYRKLGYTIDGGRNWIEIKVPGGLEISAIALRTPKEGYVFDASGSGKLLITTDGGKRWTAQSLHLPGKSVSMDTGVPLAALRFSDAKNGCIIVNRLGGERWALFTTDGGKTWRQERFSGPFGALFLARDGRTLTITIPKGEKALISVLRRKQ